MVKQFAAQRAEQQRLGPPGQAAMAMEQQDNLFTRTVKAVPKAMAYSAAALTK